MNNKVIYQKTFGEKALYFALLSLKRLLQIAPLRISFILISPFAYIAAFICSGARKLAYTQLCFVTNNDYIKTHYSGSHLFKISSEKRIFSLILHNFAHAAKTAVESMCIHKLLAVKNNSGNNKHPFFKYVTYENRPIIDMFIAGNKPCIALSGHIGSFELLAAYHARLGRPVYTIGRDSDNKAFAQFVADIREGYGVKTIWRSDTASGQKLLRAIKQNAIIAVLIDQDTRLPNMFAKFFGLDAAYPEAPIKLALRFKMDIYSSFIVRVGFNNHRIISERIEYDPEDPNAHQVILDTYSKRLEKLICDYPEQWVWWHRRWRRRPGVNYDEKTVWPISTNKYIEWLRGMTISQF